MFKLIDRWYEKNFNILIHIDPNVKREILRFKLRDERDFKKAQKRLDDDLNKEIDEI